MRISKRRVDPRNNDDDDEDDSDPYSIRNHRNYKRIIMIRKISPTKALFKRVYPKPKPNNLKSKQTIEDPRPEKKSSKSEALKLTDKVKSHAYLCFETKLGS